jgi:hypothetical protein
MYGFSDGEDHAFVTQDDAALNSDAHVRIDIGLWIKGRIASIHVSGDLTHLVRLPRQYVDGEVSLIILGDGVAAFDWLRVYDIS